MGKYFPYLKLEKIIAGEKEQGKRVVLTGGAFDVTVHPGHIYLFRKCKELGDILVVNVVNDERVRMYKGETRPILGAYERAIYVGELESVDYVTIHPSVKQGPTIDLAILIKPHVIVRSTERPWLDEDRQRLMELMGYVPELINIERTDDISSTEIIEALRKRAGERFAKGTLGANDIDFG